MPSNLPACGLYAITSSRPSSLEALVRDSEAALRGGAAMLQYRRKHVLPDTAALEARTLVALCRRYGAPLIVNDDVELALAVGAHGVHLGRDDGDVGAMVAAHARDLVIGASCYASLERAEALATLGVSYLAFGSMFESSTKPDAVRCPLAALERAKADFGLPVVAIGGITPENAPSVIAAGADFLAVIGGVFEQADIEQSALRYARLFANEK